MTDWQQYWTVSPERESILDVDDARGNLGLLPSLFRRLARAFGGDPISKQVFSSTGTGNVKALTVPDLATSCIGFVSGTDIIYSVDGNAPDVAGTDIIRNGSRFMITGMPSLKAFQWASSSAVTATISVTYYT